MERKIIQLLTHRKLPDWWQELSSWKDIGDWKEGDQIDPKATLVVIPRHELTEFRKEELPTSKSYVVVDSEWSQQSIKRALMVVRGALVMDLDQSSSEKRRIFETALARQAERERHGALMQMMRTQNRKIHELNSHLEQEVRERTANVGESRRASQRNIVRMRQIIGFIKEISQVLEISEMLPVIRKQVKEYHQLQSPILFIPRDEASGDFFYMRGSSIIRVNRRAKVEGSARIRMNEPVDSHFLADAMGRPFGKVLRFPLITARHRNDVARAPLLLFEYDIGVDELESIVSNLSEKLQPVSWALDRLILEEELKSTSRDWEMTFDGLSEPIAILDPETRVLRANRHWREEFCAHLSEVGSSFRWNDQTFVVEKYPIRMGTDSEILSWVVYLRDATKSQKLKSQAVQVEKMSAIGQLAGHIAHELNNPLTGIRSLSQVLLTEQPPESRLYLDLIEVEHASARCQDIINNLLEFSKGDLDHKIRTMDLNEIARRTLPFLKSATGRLRSDIQLSEDELPVKVEPQLMQQVIFNLINNACQVLPEKGELIVHTRRTPSWAILEVKDSGPGIATDLLERIFEPFFTTKADGEGTGLGLSLSRDFVRQFGGEIECESVVGEGSTFRVRLPLETSL